MKTYIRARKNFIGRIGAFVDIAKASGIKRRDVIRFADTKTHYVFVVN